ncbi:MAG: DNA polymerase III subunit delta [Patescibacteria group bacterium]
MFYFFYGQNTFAINEKVREIEQRFLSGSGTEYSLIRLQGATLTQSQYSEAIFGLGFFSDKKLVEIKGALADSSDQNLKKFISETLPKISDSVVVIFIEDGEPDKRGALYKLLNQPKRSQRFPLPEGVALRHWIKGRVESLGGQIDPRAVARLEQFLGFDFWRLNSEIQKLVLYCRARENLIIKSEDVDELVHPETTLSVFELTDALGAGNIKRAFAALKTLTTQGEDEIKVFSLIVSHFRTLLIVSDLSKKGMTEREIPSSAAVHPYVVKKALVSLRLMAPERLCYIYHSLARTDLSIKTGAVDPATALDLLLATIGKSSAIIDKN